MSEEEFIKTLPPKYRRLLRRALKENTIENLICGHITSQECPGLTQEEIFEAMCVRGDRMAAGTFDHIVAGTFIPDNREEDEPIWTS